MPFWSLWEQLIAAYQTADFWDNTLQNSMQLFGRMLLGARGEGRGKGKRSLVVIPQFTKTNSKPDINIVLSPQCPDIQINVLYSIHCPGKPSPGQVPPLSPHGHVRASTLEWHSSRVWEWYPLLILWLPRASCSPCPAPDQSGEVGWGCPFTLQPCVGGLGAAPDRYVAQKESQSFPWFLPLSHG